MVGTEIVKLMDRVIDAIDRPISAAALFALGASVTLVFAGAIIRFVFLYTFEFIEDFCVNMIIWAVMLYGAPIFKEGAHVGMGFISEKLSGVSKVLQDLSIHLGLLLICGILIWYGTEFVQMLYQTGQTTQFGKLKEWYLMLPVPVGCSIFGFYGIAGIVKIIFDPKGLRPTSPALQADLPIRND